MAASASTHVLLLTNVGERDLGDDTPPTGSAGVGTTLKVSKATADLLVAQRKARILSGAEAKAHEDRAAAKAAGKPAPEPVQTDAQKAAALENSRIATSQTPSADAPKVKAAMEARAEAQVEADADAAKAAAKATKGK